MNDTIYQLHNDNLHRRKRSSPLKSCLEAVPPLQNGLKHHPNDVLVRANGVHPRETSHATKEAKPGHRIAINCKPSSWKRPSRLSQVFAALASQQPCIAPVQKAGSLLISHGVLPINNTTYSNDNLCRQTTAAMDTGRSILQKSATPLFTQKQHKSIVHMPCRARKMLASHNALTAFFSVDTSKVEHGDPLECSFPLCRNTGIKFRFCIHCKAPVSSRTFKAMHLHPIRRQPPSPKSVSVSSSPDDEAEETPQNTKTKALATNEDNVSSSENKGFEWGAGSVPTTSSTVTSESDERDTMKAERRKDAWLLLLVQRPEADDEMGLSEWLMKILAVSESAKDIEQILSNTPMSTTDSPLKNKSRNPSGSFSTVVFNRCQEKEEDVAAEEETAASSSVCSSTSTATVEFPELDSSKGTKRALLDSDSSSLYSGSKRKRQMNQHL